MLIKLVEQKNEEITKLKEVNEDHKELNGKLRAENDDLQKSVDQIYDDYQDIGKLHFYYLENHKCRHCDADESFYCEECYQKLIADNTELQHKLNHSNMQIENKDDIIKNMAVMIGGKRIIEQIEKKVKENEVPKVQTEEM